MARKQVFAAGGIVVWPGDTPLIAIVQRRKDGNWVLPKGKLEPNEDPIDGARREVIEETGHDVTVHEFLGVVSYPVRGGIKLAQFWRMQALDGPARTPMPDIRAMDWLPLIDAVERLAVPHEQLFLGGLAPHLVGRAFLPHGKRSRKAGGRSARVAPPPLVAPAAEPPPGLLRRITERWHARGT
ncbi:NUDIX hydrolase [Rhodovulum sp. PH10]|uniref:NUDIX hydrolase n=1 Tax=Rhodovulum sp. PH10 TaxID=1187851 RepID=UPI00027C2E47|nr:NUDIX domain-containing protein [Rhodovulum sp. PH10]EJW10439.1 NUDIX hydrolase [Rhodovulum sp. PH10]